MEEINQPLASSLDWECKIRHIPIKRAFDIFFSLAVLCVGLPLFFLIALLIRVTSKGKTIYAHERVGRGGVPFYCYKFRTMYKDADVRLETLLTQNHLMQQEWEEKRKLKNDPRITSIGRFLRKTSLDELPQFWNVLIGDLSVVGPRPVVQAEVDQYYNLKSSKILSVRPGLTCLWQVSGRSDTSYARRIKLDEEYVDNQSISLDIKLILQTIPAMLSSKGAY